MTTEARIIRLAEYWCYHKPRIEEMANEFREEIRRISQEAFANGMAFQSDSSKPDFEEYWQQLLSTEIKY